MRAVIYARYSSDLQRDASIADQVRVCRRRIDAEGWSLLHVYSDHGASGASHLRASYQALMRDAREQKYDVVVAESLDRLSRDQEHVAGLYKLLSFHGVVLVTIGEGEITELHVGLKGAMSALYLKDLAQKTRRGLEGRVRQGRSAGGISYGYRIVRSIGRDGAPTTGEREIDEREAEVVRGIFAAFASGKSPRAIAKDLNDRGVPGPRGKPWGGSTIYGNQLRGTGVLNNELYVGRLVWNRQRFVKDPEMVRRRARPNPKEEWVVENVPALRIVSDDLWTSVKARQSALRQHVTRQSAVRPEHARRPRYLFSGLITCGDCVGGYTLVGARHYGCANARNRGTCGNRLTIRRDVLEETVLRGLKENLLQAELIGEFVTAYQQEYNRLRREQANEHRQANAELARIERQIRNIVEAVKAGMFAPAMKDEMAALEERKARLVELTRDQVEEPPMLHPGLAEVYRRKVETLTQALNKEELRAEAAEILRSTIQTIRLVPEDGELMIELVGELAGILGLSKEKGPRPFGPGARQITLVAGARNWLNLLLVAWVAPWVQSRA
jgi:DNA invertase Pin-like site-specific DNA recombinase